MFIRLLNHFVCDTPLNKVLRNRSFLKYESELQKLISEYHKQSRKLPTRFVVFNFPRSGSNFLCTMLNNHPDILCHQELFNPGRIFYSRDFHILLNGGDEVNAIPWEDLIHGKGGFSNKTQRDFQPEKFLVNIWRWSYGAQAVGFNLFPTHVPNMAPSLLRDKNIRKILLIRKNKVRCYVSRAIARKTDVWADFSRNSSKLEKAVPPSVRVDAGKLLSWSQRYDKYFQQLRHELVSIDEPFFEVTYEDLTGDASSLFKERMLDFIGVSQRVDALKPLNKRQSSKKLSDLISNYHELKQSLAGTDLEALI